MKNKILLILGILIILFGIIGGAYFLMKDEPSSPTSNPENGEKYPGTGGEELREDFYDWETELNDKMLKMLNEVYPENHKFDLNTGETLEINLMVNLMRWLSFTTRQVLQQKLDLHTSLPIY